MKHLKEIDIRKLDGKLLLVFRELLRRRRASDVAEHLGLTQSAISHSLARLRDVFSDPLFVRRAQGLEPTRRALELAPKIEKLIDLAGSMLLPTGFDASTSDRRFTIAAPQYVVATLGGELLRLFGERAPRASIAFQDVRSRDYAAALKSGEIDVALGRFDTPQAGCAQLHLYSDRYCVAVRKDHPQIRDCVNLDAYRNTGAIFATGGIDGSSHAELPSASLVATLAVVPHWTTALALVAETDGIATCSRRLAERYGHALNLRLLEPPAAVVELAPPFQISALYLSPGSDPGVDWLTTMLQSSSAKLRAPAHSDERRSTRRREASR